MDWLQANLVVVDVLDETTDWGGERVDPGNVGIGLTVAGSGDGIVIEGEPEEIKQWYEALGRELRAKGVVA